MIPRDAMLELLQAARERTLVWVDEAYLEYADPSQTLERDVAKGSLIVLRSLSKTLALSGLRRLRGGSA